MQFSSPSCTEVWGRSGDLPVILACIWEAETWVPWSKLVLRLAESDCCVFQWESLSQWKGWRASEENTQRHFHPHTFKNACTQHNTHTHTHTRFLLCTMELLHGTNLYKCLCYYHLWSLPDLMVHLLLGAPGKSIDPLIWQDMTVLHGKLYCKFLINEVYSQHSQLKDLDGNCTHLGSHAQGQAQNKLPDPDRCWEKHSQTFCVDGQMGGRTDGQTAPRDYLQPNSPQH